MQAPANTAKRPAWCDHSHSLSSGRAMALHDPEFLRKAAEARAQIKEVTPAEVEALQAQGGSRPAEWCNSPETSAPA